MPRQKSEAIRETATCEGLTLQVDSPAGLIRGVKILGPQSSNGREYSPAAIREAATLYEGIRVNLDHAKQGESRRYADRIGRLENVQARADGLFGDLRFNPKHPLAEQLAWDAEHSPGAVGLSHDAVGQVRRRDGRLIVESITKVHSVDLVANPATTNGLFEEAEPDGDEGDGDASPNVAQLPDDDFALVLPGGVKLKNRTHPLSKRIWPLKTAAQVKAALASIPASRRFSQANRDSAMRRARAAAERLGVSVTKSQKESAMDLDKLTLEELRASRPDLLESLQEDLRSDDQAKAKDAEIDKLKEALAAMEAKELARATEAAIGEELKAAGLDASDKAVVSDLFRESLVKAGSPDARKALIEDRVALVGRPAPKGTLPKSERRGTGAPAVPTGEQFVVSLRS